MALCEEIARLIEEHYSMGSDIKKTAFSGKKCVDTLVTSLFMHYLCVI